MDENMLKKFGLLCLLISNTTNFSMSRQLASRLPKTIQSYMPSSVTQTPKIDQPTTSISSQNLSKRVNDIFKQQQEYSQTFRNHPAYQELEALRLSPLLQQDLVLQQKIMLLHEILQYCQQHTEETEDIMTFYTNMKNADSMIKEKLAQQPEHFQRFFNQQLQQYIQTPYQYTKANGSTWIKEIILKYFNSPIIALKTTCKCLLLIKSFLISLETADEIKTIYSLRDIDDPDLAEVIDLLKNALNIPELKITQQITPSNLIPAAQTAAYIPPLDIIVLQHDSFFKLSLASQIAILLHELRHGMQNRGIVELSDDIIEYAKSCNTNLGWGLHEFFKQGIFWSSPLREFDAEYFAYKQMKDSSSIQHIAQEVGQKSFNPKIGYFSKEMILQLGKNPKTKVVRNAQLERQWNRFLSRFKQNTPVYLEENKYFQHIPEHLAQAAAKNRTARAKLLAQQQNETLFDRYLKKLEAEDLIS